MPYEIKKIGDEFCVVKGGKGKSGGKFSAGHKFGCHSTRAKAERQMAAIHANESFIDRLEQALMETDETQDGPESE